MSEAVYFGEWVARHRKSLDLTQRDLAQQASCALATIKKIETGERKPSRELAAIMADALQIPAESQTDFVACARGLRPVDVLHKIRSASPKPERAIAASHIPSSAAPIVGRTDELSQIGELLTRSDCRLLTLSGPGGVGKTRLALEAARVQRDHFADGVIVVMLPSITDGALIPAAIAQQLQLGQSGSADTLLLDYLHDKNMLLVLDNCEHVLDRIEWLSALLSHAPGIKILATSRERLQLAEEWIFPVPMLEAAPALELFAQSARRANPKFDLGSVREDVVEICRLVEYLPLAIELAASWTPFMPCDEIARHIQRDIDFLSANVRNIPARHRSIRAVFDHSWMLLSPVEQDVLMRLSVFHGGWTLDEAAPVAGATLPILRSLIEKSLIRASGQGRFDMHELIRQYAADQLAASGYETETRQRHADVYLALAGVLDAQRDTASGIEAFARLDHEQDNFRAGLAWSLHSDAIDKARQYVDKLSLYWWRRGHWAEGERWTKAVDARPDEGDSTLLCWVLMDAAFFLVLQGRYAESAPYMARAEAMAARLEDPETTMRVLIVQAQQRPDIESAAAIFEHMFEMATLVEEHSKSGLESMLAAAHDIYGDRLRDVGRFDEAEEHYHKSLELWRRMGNVDGIAYPIGNLGRLALQDGRFQEACDRLSQSVAISRAIGNRVGIADWLRHLGDALLCLGDMEQAEASYDETLALFEEIGDRFACADVLAHLGYAALVNGNQEAAKDYIQRSQDLYRQNLEAQQGPSTHKALSPDFLLYLKTKALLLVDEADYEQAARLFSAVATQEPQIGYGPDLGLRERVVTALNRVKIRLEPEVFNQAWKAGQSMSPYEIVTNFTL
jgi:predicted ATPase/DNA-binding XRE family transcriptional regulator